MNSKRVVVAVVAVALVLLAVSSPGASQGCISDQCRPEPASPGTVSCAALCRQARYGDGVCTTDTQAHTSSCTCSGSDNSGLFVLPIICEAAACSVVCESCGYGSSSCEPLDGGNGVTCTCYN